MGDIKGDNGNHKALPPNKTSYLFNVTFDKEIRFTFTKRVKLMLINLDVISLRNLHWPFQLTRSNNDVNRENTAAQCKTLISIILSIFLIESTT